MKMATTARWIAISIFAAAMSSTQLAFADDLSDCKGCVVVGDASGDAKPLLTVLHGDEGSPTKVVAAWKAAAEAAHVILFAPKCPANKGCKGSFWRWDGDPSWLLGQVEELSKHFPIDPKRRYLGGWSGGTTYLSMHVPSFFPTFAALSLAGGGVPPPDAGCLAHAGGACAPIHYLQGDKNPLFSYAEGAHAYLLSCGHTVEWELHRGADHAGEWRAYQSETTLILAWLLQHPEGCSAASSPETEAPVEALSATETSQAPPRLHPTDSRSWPPHGAPEPRITTARGCACSYRQNDSEQRASLWLALLVGVLAFQRRNGQHFKLAMRDSLKFQTVLDT